MGDFDWLPLILAVVSPPEQLSEKFIHKFKKAKLKKAKENMRQCKSKH
jgi:hypothetical protein